MLERQQHVGLEVAQHVVHALEVVQLDFLHLAQVDVADQLGRAQVLEEAVRVERSRAAQRLARIAQLARGQPRREAVHAHEVDPGRALAPEVRRADGGEVRGAEVAERDARVGAEHRVRLEADDEVVAALGGVRHQRRERDHQEHRSRVHSALPRQHARQQVHIIEQDVTVLGQGARDEIVESVLERERIPFPQRVHDVRGAEQRAAQCLVRGPQHGRAALPALYVEQGHARPRRDLQQRVERVLLRRRQLGMCVHAIPRPRVYGRWPGAGRIGASQAAPSSARRRSRCARSAAFAHSSIARR